MSTPVHLKYTAVDNFHPSRRTPEDRGGRFHVLERGQPLLFNLKSPDNAIVDRAFFEHYSDLPTSLAWQALGEGHGASGLAEIRQRTARLR